MKRIKITVSALLAAAMLFSCTVPALAQSSAMDAGLPRIELYENESTDGAEKVVSESVASLTGELETYFASGKDALYYGVSVTAKPSKPTDEAYMEKYNAKVEHLGKITAAYKALSEDEKNSIDIVLAGKLMAETVNREAYLINAADSSIKLADAKISVSAKIGDYLGECTARDKAYKLAEHYYNTFDGKNKLSTSTKFESVKGASEALDAYVADYKAADALTRSYLDCVSASGQFVAPTVGSKLKDIITMMGNRDNAQNPSGVTVPASPKKPNVKNYEGENDPEYIKAMSEYLEQRGAYYGATAEQKNHLYGFYANAMQELKGSVPEYAAMLESAILLRDGYIEFNTTGKADKATAAVKAYDALSEEQKEQFNGIKNVYAYYKHSLNAAGNDYTYSNVSYSQLYAACDDASQIAVVTEFENWVNAVDLNRVNNYTVAEARDRYNSIPSSLRGKISDEAMEKYNAIIALYDPVKPMTPSDDKFESLFADFRPTSIPSLNMPLARPIANCKVNSDNALVASILKTALANGDKNAAAADGVFSNASMATLLSLYKELTGMELEVSGVNIAGVLEIYLKPSAVAGWLTEEKFAGAKAKLSAAAETDDTTAAYSSIVFENGDWGFADGDKEGFKEAVAAMLRPVANVLHNGALIISQIVCLPNSKAANGDHIYGAYEQLIPLLEALGLKGVISSEEYTARFNEAQKVSKEAGLSALFLPIVAPIVDLVDELLANPIYTLLDLMPRLARALNFDLVTTSVKNFLNTSSLLSGVAGDLDLSADAINAMIDGKTITIDIGSRLTATISLKAIDWVKLAGCGSLVLADSVSASNKYRVDIIADRAAVNTLLARYIVKLVFTTKLGIKQTTVSIVE